MATYKPKIPPMAEMIEDYASSTQDLCMLCRAARTPRFNLLQEIVVTESTPKTPQESFRVCSFCDVDEDTRYGLR